MKVVTEEVLKKVESVDLVKRVVEGEFRRWRERE